VLEILIGNEGPTRRVARTARGVTLLEMLIVLVVIAILSAITYPVFAGDTPTAKVRRSAQQLAEVMREARFRAISLNRDVYVHIQPGGAVDFYTAYANLGDPGDVPTGTPAEIAASGVTLPDAQGSWRGRQLDEDVTLSSGSAPSAPGGGVIGGAVDLPSNPIVFDSRGTVKWPSDGQRWSGHVYLTHKKHSTAVRAVSVSRTGLVKVWHLHGGEWR
jgi:prepilin-type N-terminal cleavage/methylation domain-containing protein